MRRFSRILAALLSAALVLAPQPAADAATKKKSTTTKKKPTPAPKADAAAGLDLPLPEKAAPSEAPPTPAATSTPADKSAETSAPKRTHAPNATVEPDDLREFSRQPSKVQQLIRDALDLTRLDLNYTFGSADPDSGGMDCSGTIYYLLRAHSFAEVPRDSSGQYLWARKHAAFFPVLSTSAESVEFAEMLPGDLLFWTGTYEPAREVPVSHVMLYLGREKESGKRIMFGASDGRSYNGIQRWGVSVFDFKMPRVNADPEKNRADFVGFARIPGLRSASLAAAGEEGGASSEPAAKATPTPKPKPRSTSSKKKKRKS